MARDSSPSAGHRRADACRSCLARSSATRCERSSLQDPREIRRILRGLRAGTRAVLPQ